MEQVAPGEVVNTLPLKVSKARLGEALSSLF